jgi:hypothetical protein
MISIKGPFSSSFQGVLKESRLISVSSGSGVSVTSSLLQTLGAENEVEMLVIVHSERNSESFTSLIEAVSTAVEKGGAIKSVHLFLTGNEETDLESGRDSLDELRWQVESRGMIFVEDQSSPSPSYQNSESGGGVHARGNSLTQVVLHRGRLDLLNPFANEALRVEMRQDRDAHFVISGGLTFNKMIKKFCTENGLEYTEESFLR